MPREWWPTNPKYIYSVALTLSDFVPVLNTLFRKLFDLSEFNEIHNAAMFSSKCKTFALQVRTT